MSSASRRRPQAHVVKVGSSLSSTSKAVGSAGLARIARGDLKDLGGQGAESWLYPRARSRARAGGNRRPRGPLKLGRAQAAAAVGQVALASHESGSIMGDHGIVIGQVLLTLGRHGRARRYFERARTRSASDGALGVVPVINENDTVATSEIRTRGNDRLRRASRRWSAPTAWCFSPTSTGLYRAAGDGPRCPLRRLVRRSRGYRGDGGCPGLGAFARRDDHQIEAAKIATAAGRGWRLPRGGCRIRSTASMRGEGDLVRAAILAGAGAKSVDRRTSGAARTPDARCRRGHGAARRKSPPAGRRDCGVRRFLARHTVSSLRRRPRDRPGLVASTGGEASEDRRTALRRNRGPILAIADARR